MLSTSDSYTIDPSEADQQITLTVTATDDQTSNTAVAKTGDMPTPSFANTVAPSISGSLVEGSTLTVNPGTWTNQAALTFSYNWGDADGGSGGPTDPEDLTMTHVTNSADLGLFNTVSITVTDGVTTETIQLETAGVITAPAATLPTTGVNVNVPLELGGAGILLLLGLLSVVFVTRRRRQAV